VDQVTPVVEVLDPDALVDPDTELRLDGLDDLRVDEGEVTNRGCDGIAGDEPGQEEVDRERDPRRQDVETQPTGEDAHGLTWPRPLARRRGAPEARW
jgi:hypothetical protein